MLDFLETKADCTGCAACINICPKQCIKMKVDEEGFSYPVVSQNDCIHCGLCEKKCPSLNPDSVRNESLAVHAYAAITKDDKTWKESASGGAFTEICNAFVDGNEDYAIVGCELKDDQIFHSTVFSLPDISKFRKSKYVQSSVGLIFQSVKTYLREGKKVLFVGTPCQVAGLKKYLGKSYEHLLTIDFICHGVGSPEVFKTHIKYLREKYNDSQLLYSFRNKTLNARRRLNFYTSNYQLSSGIVKYVERDEYNRLFLSQVCLRPCCSTNCKYRNEYRVGDITIADFKQKEKVLPENNDYRNYSTIVLNTKKGEALLAGLNERMIMIPVEMDDIKKYNPLFYKTTPGNPSRNSFFEDYKNGMSYLELVSKYAPIPQKSLRQRLYDLLFPQKPL